MFIIASKTDKLLTSCDFSFNRKIVFFVTFILFTIYSLQAQIRKSTNDRSKGVEVVVDETKSLKDSVRRFALLIGVSEYSFLPKLKYADDDVYALRNVLLKSRTNGFTDKTVHVLTDLQATKANVFKELNLIFSDIQEDDEFVFYFSGHGDRQNYNEAGYMLCVQCKPNVYSESISDAISFEELNKYLFEKLKNKNVRIYFIVDACHAGNGLLNFSSNSNLDKINRNVSADVFRLLSSHDSQLSIERVFADEGGRGIFSYYLTKGLDGDADEDQSNDITWSEISSFVSSRTLKASGKKQNPHFSGAGDPVIFSVQPTNKKSSKEERISGVFDTLKIGRSISSDKVVWFSSKVENKQVDQFNNLYDKLLVNQGSENSISILEKKRMLNELRESFNQLSSLYSNDLEFKYLLINLVADVTNITQEFFNEYLAGSYFNLSKDFQITENLNFLLELNSFLENDVFPRLNSNNSNTILPETYFAARKKFIEAYILFRTQREEAYQKAVEILINLLKEGESQSYAHNLLGMSYLKLRQYNLAKEAFYKAIELSPYWMYPYRNLGSLFNSTNKPDSSIWYYLKAWEINKNDPPLLNNIGNYYFNSLEFEKANYFFNASLSLDSTYSNAWNTLGRIRRLRGKYNEAEKYLLKAINFSTSDKSKVWPYINLASIFVDKLEYEKARIALSEAEKYNGRPHDFVSYWRGIISLSHSHADSAICFFRQAKNLNPAFAYESNYALANVFYIKQQLDSTQFYLNKVMSDSIAEPALKARACSALGYFKLINADITGALHYFEKSLSQHNAHPDVYYGISLLNMQQNCGYYNLLDTSVSSPKLPFYHFIFPLDKVLHACYLLEIK